MASNEDLARLGLKTFSYEQVIIMTDSFAENRILGEGGSATVYRGHLKDPGREVAVKKIRPHPDRGEKEFKSEVMSLSQLSHKNLVQLVGYCHGVDNLVVVYEFIQGGSLADHLFGDKPLLTWKKRYNIALELASALFYLHKLYHQCVIHGDIKSSNIMLNENFVVKLGDFGLARLIDHNGGTNPTQMLGTLGYMAPECLQTKKASKEADVYSFGVVILEIVCGRRVFDLEQGLVPWVWEYYGSTSFSGRGNFSWHWRRNFLKVVDQRVSGDFNEEQAEALLIVGLWCAHPIAKSRPSIDEAMKAMDVSNFKKKRPNLPAKMPSFSISRPRRSRIV